MLGQLPPQRSFSISATRAPCSCAALLAASRAAEPPPITIKSNCSLICAPPSGFCRRPPRRLIVSSLSPSLQSRGGVGRVSRVTAPRRAARGGRVRVRRFGARVPAVARARGADLRLDAGSRGGGCPGDLARRAQRARPLRGPLLVAHLDLSDPDEHREDTGPARRPNTSLLGAAESGTRARGGARRRPVPRPRAPALAGPLGGGARGVARGRAHLGRDARAAGGGDRGAAGLPAGGHLLARHRGLEQRGGA